MLQVWTEWKANFRRGRRGVLGKIFIIANNCIPIYLEYYCWMWNVQKERTGCGQVHICSTNRSITKTSLFKYIENFISKTENFQIKPPQKTLIFFHISAQNIDCGYSLEPPRRSAHNLCFWAEIRKIMYTPVNPSFTMKRWGLRVSKLYRHVFVMGEISCWVEDFLLPYSVNMHSFENNGLPL